MKRSIGLRTHDSSLTAGGSGFSGGRNAQCSFQTAPSSIHVLIVSICSGVSSRCEYSGGMCRASVAVMRW